MAHYTSLAKSELPRVGQFNVAATLGVSWSSKVILQDPDLPADGVRRYVQLLAHLYYSTRLGDPPKIVKMFLIHRGNPSFYAIHLN